MKPSGIHHVAICVRDADEAVTFYRDVLGLTVLDRPDFGFGGYWLDAGGQQLHLMQSDSSRTGGDHFAIVISFTRSLESVRGSHANRLLIPYMSLSWTSQAK